MIEVSFEGEGADDFDLMCILYRLCRGECIDYVIRKMDLEMAIFGTRKRTVTDLSRYY